MEPKNKAMEFPSDTDHHIDASDDTTIRTMEVEEGNQNGEELLYGADVETGESSPKTVDEVPEGEIKVEITHESTQEANDELLEACSSVEKNYTADENRILETENNLMSDRQIGLNLVGDVVNTSQDDCLFAKSAIKIEDQVSEEVDEAKTYSDEMGAAESSVLGESSPDTQEERKEVNVKLVVWNKDRSLDNRRIVAPNDYNFYRVKVPTAKDLKQKEQGAKSSRCRPDSISNCSKTIKKGRRVTALKHVEYKQFLQCYIHLQDLKNYDVDKLFNKSDPEPSTTSGVRRRRGKTGPKESKMSTAFVECSAVEAEGIAAVDFPTTNATLGLVEEFDDQIMSIDTSNPEEIAFTVDLGGIDDVANFEQVDLVDSFHVSSSPPRRNEFGSVEISFDETGKPRCTYTDLIERALSENGGLTVSEIYQWISDHYPFFKPDDDRWKNSVRHNLSINPYFNKGEKARSGAGHLWTISEESRALRPPLRKNFDFEELPMSIENETDRAVANILGQYHLAKNNMDGKGSSKKTTEEDSDSLCTPPTPLPQPIQAQLVAPSSSEEDKFMEISPVVIEYESNGFQGGEYTIDLSQFQFPDSGGLSFDDLMPGGGLIVIQDNQDDQDANKENVQADTSNTEYLMSDYSTIRHDSQSQITETERVSGQLISETLNDFEMHKDKCDLIPISAQTCEDLPQQHQPMCQDPETHLEIHHLETPTSENTQEYLTLDSIDHLALQEVIHGNSGNETDLHQYQMMMNVADYETNKDVGGYCNFATEVAP